MSANMQLVDAMTRHQVFIQQYAGGQINEILPVLERMSRDIRLRILDANTEFQVYRLQSLLTEIDGIINASGGEIGERLIQGMNELSEYEADFTVRMLSEYLNVDPSIPSPQQIAATVTQARASIVQGNVIREFSLQDFIDQFTTSARRQVAQEVRAGFIAGDPLMDVVRRVQPVADRKLRQQAGAMVRTATNHISSQARQRTYLANSNVLKGEEWTSVLDLRTTFVCMSRDGKIYPVGEGPQPPAHFACRSVRAPVVKDEFAIPETGGQRAARGGPVSAQKTYGSWLRDQSEAFQNEALGVERAKLFRSGNVSIDRFVDDQGRARTLDQLRAVEGVTLE